MRQNGRTTHRIPLLLRSSGALGLVQFFNHAPGLVALAFVARAVGPESLGIYAVVVGVCAYVGLLVDFGFNVTAARSVAQAGDDAKLISRIFADVQGARFSLGLAGVSIATILVLALGLPSARQQLVALVIVQVIATSLTPIWLFIGLQRAERLLAAFAVCRSGAALCAVLAVTGPDDLRLFAAINSLGAVVLLVWVFLLTVPAGVTWRMPQFGGVRSQLRHSAAVFVASASINVYTASTPLIVAAVLGPIAAGQYAIADRVRQVVLGALTPISQAVFPIACRAAADGASDELVRTRNRGFAGLLLLAGLISSVLWAGAEQIVNALGGAEFGGAVAVLAFTAFIPVLVTASTILGTHVLVAHGRRTDFLAVAGVSAVVGVSSLWALSRALGLAGAGLSMVVTELVALTLLLVLAARRRLLPIRLHGSAHSDSRRSHLG